MIFPQSDHLLLFVRSRFHNDEALIMSDIRFELLHWDFPMFKIFEASRKDTCFRPMSSMSAKS